MIARSLAFSALALGFAACGSSSSGGTQAPTVTAENPCLGGRTWTLRTASNSNVQNTGTWEFRTDGRYVWIQTAPLQVRGEGTWSYSNGVLEVDGFLQQAFVRSGLIALTFDNNRMSFTTDTRAVFTFDPPNACALVLRSYAVVQAGVWQFDTIQDGEETAETLAIGRVIQDGGLVRIDAEPQLVGELRDETTWEVQVGPDFLIRGEFTNHPATRFRGTYVRGTEIGQVFGHVTDAPLVAPIIR